jgi:hypothetical protein
MTDFDVPEPPEHKVPRDHLGRPKIMQPDGKLVPYTRCTTYVGCMEDQYNIQLWRQRMVAVGLADRQDLVLSVAAHRDNRDALNRIVEQAAEAGKASAPANVGTALHALTDRIDRGEPLGVVPEAYRADLDAYRTTLASAGISVVMIEPFTVCDELQIGGTPDRLYMFQDKGYIGDTKSGSLDFGGLKFGMQMSVYSRSIPYDHATGNRTPYPISVDQDKAILVHLPAGTGRCELHWVDIAGGWQAVQTAREVRGWRNKGKRFIQPFAIAEQPTEMATRMYQAIEAAGSVDTLYEIYEYAIKQGIPEDVVVTACITRRAQLEGQA